MATARPLLSICIPTYNRAALLEDALSALIPQVLAADGRVELLVSDNCSHDATPLVVERMQAALPALRYNRNPVNLGVTGNISILCDKLAVGDFAWLVGDDDVVLPGTVQALLAVLDAWPHVDYVFVNTVSDSPENRADVLRDLERIHMTHSDRAKSKDLSNHAVARWEELIDPAVDDAFLGALMCGVFRLSRWRMYKLRLNPPDPPFSTLADSYPHSVAHAHTMVGRPAYYIGRPCTINFWGAQEWAGYLPLMLLVRLQELLDLYVSVGVERRRVEKCRRFLLSNSGVALQSMLANRAAPGRRYFSFTKFLWRNRHHPAVLLSICHMLVKSAIRRKTSARMYNLLRSAKRTLLHQGRASQPGN